MNDILKTLCDQLVSNLGSNLETVLLYGSAAKNESNTAHSDINILILFKDVSLDQISVIRETLRRAEERHRVRAHVWNLNEWRNSADVFPIEFIDIQANHRVLYGRNPFDQVQISTQHLRHQLEYEIRSFLLTMRREWLYLGDEKVNLKKFLIRSGASLSAWQKHLSRFIRKEIHEQLQTVLEECLKLKTSEQSDVTLEHLQKTFKQLHQYLSTLASTLDAFTGSTEAK